MGFRVGVVGCRFNTLRFLKQLRHDNVPVDFILTLDPDSRGSQNSGYVDLTPFAETHRIETYRCHEYRLTEHDRAALASQRFDIVFCVGWQRLLPDWFLATSRQGVFGMHGSCYKLPMGRGRSPQVWSIIEGSETYYAHVFQYASGADDGRLMHVQEYDITPFDTAASLQLKSQIVFNQVIKDRWTDIVEGDITLFDQPDVEPTYFRKRSPEDGLIDFGLSGETLANFIRAQTRPYPGAYTFLGDQQVRIWKARVFDSQLRFTGQPGEILEVIDGFGILVQTADHPLLVEEADVDFSETHLGEILGHQANSRL